MMATSTPQTQAPTATVATTTTNTPQANEPSRPRRNRGRGHARNTQGGSGDQVASNASLAMRPASIAPPSASAQHVANRNGSRSIGTNAASHRGAKQKRGTHSGLARHGGGSAPLRQFGGALTSADDNVSEHGQNALQADAAAFIPGKAYELSTKKSTQKQNGPRSRRMSRSNAPDITTRVHEDIDNHQYECAICTSEVLRKSKIWSCHTCWTVFHLHCIKQWASAVGSQDQQPQNGQPAAPRQWRCPGCNLPQDEKPSSYTCWCGKDHEPRSITGLPPHSCGQTCGKVRVLPKKCPHPCELMCHAGPCPPCAHIGPKQSCYCGRETSQKKCSETQYEDGWSCGNVCGDMMPCGEHTCERGCHEGLCGACEVRLEARCYCGKEEKAILCADRDDDKASSRAHILDTGEHVTESWTGMFQCTSLCERQFSCGIHSCQKPCHAQDDIVPSCPRSPELVTHCPCGKTALSEMSNVVRQTCEDPIPRCEKLCMRPLSCGHPCQKSCHVGACAPCAERISITCRCGRTTSQSMCHQGQIESPSCPRVCHTTLNCGRHDCGERCCTGEKRAIERQAIKRKLRPLGAPSRPAEEGFEAEHICTRTCGRLLKCGTHTCQELCHKGACGSCPEAIFDEISCHCGRTVLQPPLPCGTGPPPCRYQCERPKGCGHPQVAHNCHQDDESCPKCPFLVEKTCMCGKRTLKNQQCWFEDVKCGEVCGHKLKCGSHSCRKTCHRSGGCEDARSKCQQPCGKAKRKCNHPCEETCHAPFPCKEDKPCPHKIIITCDCQHKKKELRCNASKDDEGNSAKSLECDEECARLERNRKLAVALNIDRQHTDDHVPYSQDTLSLFADAPKWSQEQEREFRVLATSPEEKRLRFKPMTSTQRTFLHQLAEDFGFDSESMDPEPHRHVVIYKTPKFVSAPNKTLRDCIRIRQTQKMAASEAHAKAKSSTIREPYNGFLLVAPRFALIVDELENEIHQVQGPQPRLAFNIQFLSTGDVAIKVTSLLTEGATDDKAIDVALRELRMPLGRAIAAQGFGSIQMARFDGSLNVLLRESDSTSEGGWSQVAAKAAAPKRTAAAPNVDVRQSSFTVLGSLKGGDGSLLGNSSKLVKAKTTSKSRQEAVVDDWETAEKEAELKEDTPVASASVEGAGPVAEEAAAPAATVSESTTVMQHETD